MAVFTKNKGFSLVELSVTLVIVALVVAAITAGSHLMQAAKINKVIAEINGYVTATGNFRDKYKAWPGDMPNATSFWGTYHVTNNPNGTANGNGDEYISGLLTEALTAWQQMTLANMIPGKYSGIDAGTPDYLAGTNVPPSVLQGGYFYLYRFSSDTFGTKGTILQLGANDSATSPWGAVITASDAYLIDNKMDDGVPSSGDIYTLRGTTYDGVANKCVSADWSTASATYVLTDTGITCRMVYWVNKE